MARRSSWVQLTMDGWALGFESAGVIGLRTLKLAAGGPAAAVEADRMVREKIDSAVTLQGLAMTGQLGLTTEAVTAKALAHYRRKVAANRRRLTKG